MERIKFLTGEKVSLVVPEKQDIDLWYRGMNNLDISKNLMSNFGNIFHMEDEEDFYERQRKDKDNIMFSIYLNDEKKIIGNISLDKIDKLSRKAELGVSIFEEKYLGKGFGTESINLILKYAFEIFGLNKVYLRLVGFNDRAFKSYEKVGFKEVGRYKDHDYIMGEYHDEILMEIFKKDFNY